MNDIDTQLRELISSGLSPIVHDGSCGIRSRKWEGEGGVKSNNEAPGLAHVWRMSEVTRDDTAELKPQDQTLRC